MHIDTPLRLIIHYLQVCNVFAKLITLLCYLTNKDPPFDVAEMSV